MKGVFFLFLISYYLSLIAPIAYADYVLPYPSFMPGNKMYRVSRVVDWLKEYWYFGNIAKVKYHLGLADKYLVEAKTLFEYKQYLLAVNALTQSSKHFETLPVYLKKARGEGKDIGNLKTILHEAAAVHGNVLEEIETKLPDEFVWQPEKAQATDLPLGKLIREAMNLRQTVVEIIAAL